MVKPVAPIVKLYEVAALPNPRKFINELANPQLLKAKGSSYDSLTANNEAILSLYTSFHDFEIPK